MTASTIKAVCAEGRVNRPCSITELARRINPAERDASELHEALAEAVHRLHLVGAPYYDLLAILARTSRPETAAARIAAHQRELGGFVG